MNSIPSPYQGSSRFIWADDEVPPRNQFVRFERSFELTGVPAEFPLHLFADTRYRLRVNGGYVGSGPGRFVTQYPEFDTHEISRHLRTGPNSVTVEVNFFGASSFQSMPDGRPGFIAWGGNADVDLTTPGDWRAFRLDAWRWDAPLFSFAQNPVEICDTRHSNAGIPVGLAFPEGKDAPWGDLKPYSGMPIPFFLHRPKRIELAGSLTGSEWRTGFMSHDPAATSPVGGGHPRPWTAFATWIHSPRQQVVKISCFWSELQCNGVDVFVDTDTPYGNHGHGLLDLREGWNLLVGKIEILTEFWAYCLGIPNDAGISLHGRCDTSCTEPFAISPNCQREGLRLPSPADTQAPSGWVLHDGDPKRLTPARMMGWDIPADDSIRDMEIGRLPEVSMFESASATWCFSFAGEFLGHIVIEVEAPEGTVLDVACDDWQTGHGGVALYLSNPFTDAADRFVLRGGRQRIEVFHPRGGKLIQVTLRAPGNASPLSLHDIFVRSRQALGEDKTTFSCDNPSLEWAWPIAMRTLIVSTDESYSDCPWRERGSYIGDGYVNAHLNLLLSRDTCTVRRTLRIFAQAQLRDGQLPCCAPAWLRRAHEDFTLVWLLALHDYWELTGDTVLPEELWPTVRRIWESPAWDRHPTGLWNAEHLNLFIDQGVLVSEREGKANATLNMFRFGAARACAGLAKALGRTAEAASFHAEAKSVEEALISHLWEDSEGRFRPSLENTTAAVHANVLALAFGIGSSDLRSRILAFLEPKLRTNFARGLREGWTGGHIELYFFHYALPALAAHGRPDLAELLIDHHYGFLRTIGDDTLPECFCRVEQARGSRCHSWAGAAAVYAARHVLGIRPADPGNPRSLVCDPIVHHITRASGRIAHPDGWIHIAWEKRDGDIHIEIEAPRGVEVARKTGSSAKNVITHDPAIAHHGERSEEERGNDSE